VEVDGEPHRYTVKNCKYGLRDVTMTEERCRECGFIGLHLVFKMLEGCELAYQAQQHGHVFGRS
jgi:hypothetical protein